MIKSIKLKDKILKFPIIQGGMGVGISLSNLAGNVMKEHCMGVLSFAHPGYKSKTFLKDSLNENLRCMKEEIDKARKISEGNGILGVNIMVASSDYAAYVKACVDYKVDAIISGAGLPLNLPELTKGSDILIAPIVSSDKALNLILKRWDMHHSKTADFIVIEGFEAGGHLGFKNDDIKNGKCQNLEEILLSCLPIVKIYEEKYGVKIPVFVAGGIYNGEDIGKFIKLGASGVQMGTRFIATKECDANIKFKQKIVDSKKEDIRIVKSPTGFLGRAIHNDFTRKLDNDGKIPVKFCVNCILPCDPRDTVYCISEALIKSVNGDVENGLVFCGSNAYRVDKIVLVKDLIKELIEETNKFLKESIV